MVNAKNQEASVNFIQTIIDQDLAAKKYAGQVHTRFPPEPNGYLHIGHAKSICLNFGLAQQNHGKCNLRFDDTNPVKEDVEYIESIQRDVKWLGFDWEDRLFYASDYFDRLFQDALVLIKSGKAYVCDLTADEIREYRGTLTEPGRNSPYRDRSIAENLTLFESMKNGEFSDGTRVLRAKIDMASPNLNMRDPVLYRIIHAEHHRTGNQWCIYPMYDFTHCLSDAYEGITHSVCTLEFADHRPLYDWVLDEVKSPQHPKQLEFARLNLTYTVMSKRKLLRLVQEKKVDGWDDPRMPTISGLRRRGYPPAAIRNFCDRIGVAKRDSVVDHALLEYCVREELNRIANRVMVVLNPLKVIIDNYPADQIEEFKALNNPEDETAGSRMLPFSKILFIEKDDFMEDPPKKFYRLGPGREIRLKYAYYIKCVDYKKNDIGEITEVHCTYDPDTRGGWSKDGRKVKGTSHWLSAAHAETAVVRQYEHLFIKENPDTTDASADYTNALNPNSVTILTGCKIEPHLKNAQPGTVFQFERLGYYCLDLNATADQPLFNRTVTLRDTWAKMAQKV